MDEYSLRLANERFFIYVPKTEPPQGYGLIVFVAPGARPTLPFGWRTILDREGLIFVSALNAGNQESSLDRREPLALIAAGNIMGRYRVDKTRVFVSGFSGGSRAAMRLALAYPDVFEGAILNSGSDAIGDRVTAIPPDDLMLMFQSRSRLIYLTGERDDINLSKDAESRQAMGLWCVFNLRTMTMPQLGHDIADAQSFSRALGFVERPPETTSPRLGACLSALRSDLQTKLSDARQRIARGDPRGDVRLRRIDSSYSGLAAPQSLVLAFMDGQ